MRIYKLTQGIAGYQVTTDSVDWLFGTRNGRFLQGTLEALVERPD